MVVSGISSEILAGYSRNDLRIIVHILKYFGIAVLIINQETLSIV